PSSLPQHPFPTRRSSDLSASAFITPMACPTNQRPCLHAGSLYSSTSTRPLADDRNHGYFGTRVYYAKQPRPPCARARPVEFGCLDRKSTRLNSSHVSISY